MLKARSRAAQTNVSAWRIAALALMLLPPCADHAGAAQKPVSPNVTLFVATNGNDKWSGSVAEPAPDGADGPLATLEGARLRLRKLRAGKKVKLPVDVFFREGRYVLARTVVFELADSATEQTPVTFCAYRNENVELCGGSVITDWQVGDGVWTVKLPEVASGDWYFRTLFINGARAQRARKPDNPDHYLRVGKLLEGTAEKGGHYHRLSHRGFIYRKGDLRNWPRLSEAAVFHFEAWARGIRKISELDESTRTVLFCRGARWPAIHHGEDRYWLENLPELLNAPGEWYLDRHTGVLSYMPRPGETPENTEVIAPRVARFVELRGDARAGKHVEYLHFRNLAFRYGDWEMGKNGYIAQQADIVVPGVIDLTGARHCSISRCEVSHVGLYAINLAQGSRHVRIFHNHLFDLGAGGVKIGHNYWYVDYCFQEHPDGVKQGRAQHTPLRPERRCGYTSVVNNFIHHGGVIFASGIGVCVARASWNRIAHNEISDLPYSGLSIGMSWDAGPTWAHDNLIEYNHIHRIGRRRLSDLGGIYMLGNSPGTVVRGNHVHDIHHRNYGSTCLYGDQGSSRILVEDNLFHHAGGTIFNGGFGQITVRNNIFALADGTTFWRLTGVCALHRNIIYSAGENLCAQWGKPGGEGTDYDHNLYWKSSHGRPQWNGKELDAWRKETGREMHSRIADPGFADPENGNFALSPDSPARELGFEPLDPSRVGLYGEKHWVNLPQTITPMPMADLAAGRGNRITYDFESTEPGNVPDGFVLHERRDQGGNVAVSAAGAFAGKHCLMIKDCRDIKEDWNPHLYTHLGYGKGIFELSFAVKIDAEATPTIALRDYVNGAPFTSGPGVRVDANRRILAGDKELGLQFPVGKWVRVLLVCPLDQGRNGTYSLRLALPDGAVRDFKDLSYGSGNFRIVTWLGIISGGKHDGRFYIDDLACLCRDQP